MRLTGTILMIYFFLITSGCNQKKSVKQDPLSYAYYCYKTSDKIKIDGKFNEKLWEKAPLVRPFWNPASKQEAVMQTYARILWDDMFLYIRAELIDKDIYGYHTEHDSQTWEDDVLEIFIKPKDDSSHYYELQVTPLNTTLDLLIARRNASGQLKRWSIFESGMITTVTLNGTLNNWKDKDQGWSAEVAIPLSAFRDTAAIPQEGDRWKFALCRYDYSVYLEKGNELSSSARLSAVNFHLFEDYDTLCFQGLR